jgi:PAS domain S-box-containing protein
MFPSEPATVSPRLPTSLEEAVQRLAEAEAAHLRAHSALRETEAAYRRLFELNPLPLWVFDAQSRRFLAVNQAALQTYGHTREEFLAMTVHDIRPPEEDARFRAYLAAHDDDEADGDDARSGRWLHRRKDGTLLTVETWSHSLIFDGRPSRLVIVRDVSEQLRAEEELRFSQERFQLIAAATSDAIWDLDFATDSIWWSDSFYSLFGHTRGQWPDTLAGWAGAIHADDRERVLRSRKNARDQGREFWREEYRFRRADGTVATVVDRARVVRDPSGRACRMVGGMTDITEQTRLQAQHLRSQRLESIGTLAGGIAHDLNNMLAPILLAIDLLRLHHPDSDAERLISTIETSAQRGADLVRQVLAFARGVEGRRQPLQVRHLVKECARFATETFPRDVAVQSEIAAELWTVPADPTQINQVLLNLALNARDSMPAGGRLTISATNLQVDGTFAATTPDARPGPYVVLGVEDSGHGIAPEHLDRIFEPFFTTKEVGKGTGLGLSTVHAIVREHQGFVTVQSSPGRGSLFRVHLPAQPELAPADRLPLPGPSPRGDGQTILVIDDETALRDLVRHNLEHHGYRVLLAGDGAEGVALYAQHRDHITVVVTDMAMPIMDGPATISALRRINPRVPIIAMSGHDPSGIFSRKAASQVHHFLAKPFTADALRAAIVDSLRAH